MLKGMCRRLCAGAIVLLLALSACGRPQPHAASSDLDTAPTLAGPTALASSAMPPHAVSTGASQLPPVATTSRPLPSMTATPLPTRRPTPSASAGCGAGRAAGTTVLALPGGRRALIAVPAGDTGQRRLGLVIGLPGYGQTPEQFAAQSRLLARAMAAGVLAVLPQGAGPARSWNFSGTTGYDDLAFLSALIARLVATECADAARIVIAGISDGGAWKLPVRAFQFLQANHVWFGRGEPRQQIRQAAVDIVDVEGCDLHGGGSRRLRGRCT